MYTNGIFSTSRCTVVRHKRAFLWEPPELKLRPCSRNENSVNENKISYRQITKTLSIALNIHRGDTLNTKQKKKLWLETIFETFIQQILHKIQ